MKYMGSKARIAKHLLPIILADRQEGQWYVEPFVGGANMIDKVDGNRIGADSNKYLIALLNEMQSPDFEPPSVDEKLYNDVRDNKEWFSPWVVGYVGLQMTYGAQWFSGIRRGCKDGRDYSAEAQRGVKKQSKNLYGIRFIDSSYIDLNIPSNSIIYCDPPYQNTTGYKDKFNHEEFWQWCREKAKEGHKVFISEYNAPDDFKCVWEQELNVSLAKSGKQKKAIERLFVFNS